MGVGKTERKRPKDLFAIYYFANFALLNQNMHKGAKKKTVDCVNEKLLPIKINRAEI